LEGPPGHGPQIADCSNFEQLLWRKYCFFFSGVVWLIQTAVGPGGRKSGKPVSAAVGFQWAEGCIVGISMSAQRLGTPGLVKSPPVDLYDSVPENYA
jgi:hypothetical protein